MNDLDVILTEAAAKGEAAGARLRAAIENLPGPENAGDDHLFAELRAAAADAYDAAVDLPIELREFFDADNSEPTETEPQLVGLVREIHEAVVNRPTDRLVFEADGLADFQREALFQVLRDGDVILERGSGLKLVNGTVGTEVAEVEHPVTEYGARIFYADGTMEEIHHIDGVQVAKLSGKDAGTFPFAFLAIDDEGDQPAGHRAGYFDEEGAFITFSDREAPRPGW